MTNKITSREWEAISAYLDGQLSVKERTRLEDRMQSSTELRSAMEEMRRTRIILRSQPKLRAPRNFTLTPQMVSVRPAPARTMPSLRLFPVLRFSAALASVLLVMVLIGDFFTGAPPVTTAMNPVLQQQAEIAAEQNAPPGTGGVEDTQAAGAMGIESAPPAQVEAPLPNDTPISAAKTFTETAPMAAAPAGQEPGIEAFSAITPTIEAPAIAAVPAAPLTSTLTDEASAMMARAPEGGRSAAEQPAAEQAASRALASEQIQRPLIDRQTLRVIEIILAALALGTGLLAFLLRRRANG